LQKQKSLARAWPIQGEFFPALQFETFLFKNPLLKQIYEPET